MPFLAPILISIIVGTIASVAISFVARLLTPKPKAPKIAPQGREISVRQTDAPWQIVYGEQRVGGVFALIHAAGTNSEFLYLALVLCYGGPDGIQSIDTIYFGDELAVTGTTPIAKYTGYITVENNLGTDAQTASSLLTTDIPGVWPSTATLAGHAYTVLKIKFNPDLFSDFSMENIRVQLKGRKVLDPRTGTTAYSRNPVLCIRDYLTNSRFSLGVPSASMNDTFNNGQANICDETITNKDASTEVRYGMNGTFTLDTEPGRTIQEMVASMAGSISYVGGKWNIRAGAWRPPMVALDDDDLRGTITAKHALGRRELANGIKGRFFETTQWQTTSYPAYAPADLLLEDGSTRLWQNVDFQFVTSASQAQRIAKIALNIIRKQKRIVLPCKLVAYQLIPGDTFKFTHSHFNWTEKTFSVERVELAIEKQDQNDVIVGVNIHAREEDAGVYYWNATADESTFAAVPSPTFPNAADATTGPGALALSQNGSFTYRPTSNPVTAADVGANITVSIAAFTMRIQSVGDKSVSSGSVTALSFDTLYYIYYDDEPMQGGGVTYAAATAKETSLSSGRRFFVGSIRTPADGEAATRGNNDGGATAQTGAVMPLLLPFTETAVGTWTLAGSAKDGNVSTARVHTVKTDANPSLLLSGYSAGNLGRSFARLDITTEISSNPDGDGYELRYSLNSGSSWTSVFTTSGTRVKTTDLITLSNSQDMSQVQVQLWPYLGALVGTTNHNIKVYEALIREET